MIHQANLLTEHSCTVWANAKLIPYILVQSSKGNIRHSESGIQFIINYNTSQECGVKVCELIHSFRCCPFMMMLGSMYDFPGGASLWCFVPASAILLCCTSSFEVEFWAQLPPKWKSLMVVVLAWCLLRLNTDQSMRYLMPCRYQCLQRYLLAWLRT